MTVRVAATVRGYTQPAGDVYTVIRFKRGDTGIVERNSAAHPNCVYVIWERDIAHLPRLVKRGDVRVVDN